MTKVSARQRHLKEYFFDDTDIRALADLQNMFFLNSAEFVFIYGAQTPDPRVMSQCFWLKGDPFPSTR